MKKVSNSFNKVIKIFFFFCSFLELFCFLIDPVDGPILFSSNAWVFKLLGQCYVRQLQKKKKKIQMWMIIFKKTKLQMNGLPVYFQEWGSNQQMDNGNSWVGINAGWSSWSKGYNWINLALCPFLFWHLDIWFLLVT